METIGFLANAPISSAVSVTMTSWSPAIFGVLVTPANVTVGPAGGGTAGAGGVGGVAGFGGDARLNPKICRSVEPESTTRGLGTTVTIRGEPSVGRSISGSAGTALARVDGGSTNLTPISANT